MRSLRLTAAKTDLGQALRVLGTHRRQRFSTVVPIWLRFDASAGELKIAEDRGKVFASVPASGEWPAAGATVDLYMLRGAVDYAGERIELLATEVAVVVPASHRHVRLALLAFGPDAVRREPMPPRKEQAEAERRERAQQGEELRRAFELESESEAYRFVWRRGFGEKVSILIGRRPDGIRLVLDAPRLALEPTLRIANNWLSIFDWQDLQRALATSEFWALPQEPWPDRIVLDGADWAIFGRKGDAHHYGEGMEPGPFSDLGRFLVRLAGSGARAAATFTEGGRRCRHRPASSGHKLAAPKRSKPSPH